MSQVAFENNTNNVVLNNNNNPLDAFEIKKKLSSSKYSVYHAADKKNNQQVALKVFPHTSEFAAINYKRESVCYSKFDHPNIIKMIESVENTQSNNSLDTRASTVSYIALEYAKYGDLFEIISNAGYMSEELARSIFHQLVDGIEHMHQRKVAHLDLKIENILLDEKFRVKITDFDLSQAITEGASLEARGTPGYRAPEVKKGTCINFEAADIYSLGIVLFVMLSGNPPYSEVDKGLGHEFDPFYRLMRTNTPKFWQIHAQFKKDKNFYSEDLISLIDWMLSENPECRPSIEDIKNHPWYTQQILSKECYEVEIKKYLKRANKL